MSGQIPEDVRTTLTDSGITVKSSYSSEEIGPIGFECPKFPDHYHVVSSNVLVEPSKEQFIQDGVQCNRILVTHLHSYATPLIKYDLGDLGRVLDQCPCGHNGQAISHLFGRVSGSLKRPDGTRSVFVIQNRRIVEIGGIKEYRARQVSLSKVVVDVVVDGDVPATKEKLLNLVTSVTGPGFEVDIRDCSEIDWGASTKRLSFRCEI
jgi:phenylacetate-coenzyme A ligase PaaK-like adenylate-forming protein